MLCLSRISAALCVVACLLVCLASPGLADLHWGFESGLGRNAQPVAMSFPGLAFSTLLGDDVYFADINSGWYSVTSDNGKTYEDGNYFVSGDVAAYIQDLSDAAKIAFPYGTATYFTVGYSSEFPFNLEAYDGSNNLLASASGSANTKDQGGTSLSYLTVSHPNIAYVVLHDSGGYWMMDNLSTDALVPEPASAMIFAIGVAGLILGRRKRAS